MQRQGISRFSRTRVNISGQSQTYIAPDKAFFFQQICIDMFPISPQKHTLLVQFCLDTTFRGSSLNCLAKQRNKEK